MGLRDFFRSKSGGLRPDPRLRWFGKLPTYADYYRAHGEEEWTVELSSWVLKGFELYCGRQSAQQNRPERLSNAACILRLPESQMTAFAVFFDFGGDARGRPFPMCFYVGVPTEVYPGPTLDSVAGGLSILGDLLDLKREVELFTASTSSIDDVFGSRELDFAVLQSASMDADLWAKADEVSWSDWFERIRPRLRVKQQTSWLSLVEAFGAKLSASDSRKFEPTIGFPIAEHLPMEVQIAGWIRWLGHRMDLDRRSMSMVVSGEPDQAPGSLVAVTHDVIPEDFLLLTDQASSLPYLDSLERVGVSEGSVDSEKIGTTDLGGTSWREFMESCPAST